jgi:hypothetical protein
MFDSFSLRAPFEGSTRVSCLIELWGAGATVIATLVCGGKLFAMKFSFLAYCRQPSWRGTKLVFS